MHDKNNQLTPYFEKAENLTGIKRTYLAQALLGLLGIYLIVGRAAQFFCNLIGFLYPAYKSLVALETSSKVDDSKWLTYWIVFAAFSVVEFFSDFLLSWFPVYWLAKIAFLLWCLVDTPTNGSIVIYERFVRPFFLKHKNRLTEARPNEEPSRRKEA